ncbi:MAG: TonB-dependent receptor [Hyphomonadaceae bacterium]|nr:TonB-dependent receptor [Hyphomonadaceae bacterium]
MLGRTAISLLALMGVAQAEEPPLAAASVAASSTDRVIYDAAFFAQFNPQNALDMARQTPGFTLEDGDEDTRGFSGAVGNVLIDGVRPSAKSQSLDTILERIPASQVVRLEVLRGAVVSGDASGQAVLLNVVRTPTGGSGLWGLGLELQDDNLSPRANASYSGRSGLLEWGLGASYYSETRGQPGRRRLLDANGDQYAVVDTPSPRSFRESYLNGNVAAPLFGGQFSATGQLGWFRFHADNDFFERDLNGMRGSLYNNYTEEQPSFEVGANYDRSLGAWDAALVGLVTRRYYRVHDTYEAFDGAGDFILASNIDTERDSGESILRGTLARPLGSTHRIEIGAEGAINTLDNILSFVEDDGAGPLPVDLPNANVTVEEKRGEVFVVDTWRLAERWTLETRIAREASTLTFTGDSNQSVDLAYIKPSIQLSHTFGGNNQLRLRYYRDVGQLNFDDFVSAAAPADDLVDGGNPDLKPETSWRAELGADFRLPGGVALGLTYTHFWISDVADLIAIESDNGTPLDPSDDFLFDAPGNIGDADADQLDVTLSMPLNFILPNSRLNLSGYLWQGEVTDPITGAPRTLTNENESYYEIDFRQDFSRQRLAWGFAAEKPGEVLYFRHNEVDVQEEGPWVDLWVETTALPGNARLRLTAANIFAGDILRERRFFVGDRNGPIERIEDRSRHFTDSPWYTLELSASF